MDGIKQWSILSAIAVLIVFPPQQSAYTLDDAKRLYADKVANYSKQFRPVLDQSQIVNVTVMFGLLGLKEFDEINEMISVTVYSQLRWMDENMAWTPASYGNMQSIMVDSSDFWTPPLTMTNTYDKLKIIGGSDYVIHYESSGQAAWYPGALLSALCSVDITYYPFDTQECLFQFVAWSYWPGILTFTPFQDKVDMTYFTGSGTWDITDTSTIPYFDGVGIAMKLVMKRKPLYVVVNILLPIIMMSVINLLVFVIPTASGERISYSITVLLALAVFLTIVGDNLPKTSSPMALLSYYLTGIVCVSVLITMSTVFTMRIFHRDPKLPVTLFWIRFVSLVCFMRRLRRNNKTSNIDTQHMNRAENGNYNNKAINGKPPTRHSVFSVNDMDTNEDYLSVQKKQGRLIKDRKDQQIFINGKESGDKNQRDSTEMESDMTWKDVSVAIDMFLLTMYSIVIFLLTLIIFVRMTYRL